MQFNLANMVKRRSKKPVALANIKPTQAQMLGLLAIYSQLIQLWADATVGIVAAYQVDLTRPSGSAKAEIDRTAANADGLILALVPFVAVWAARLEKVVEVSWVKSVLAATKVDLGAVLTPSDMTALTKASADWNAALIRDISAEARQRISNIVFAGLQQGASRFEIAKEIAKSTGMSRRRARNIAVDQTNKLGAALNRARQQQAGLTSYRWRHSAKLHARKWHLARSGSVFPWEGPGSIAPDDQPGVPPFCGCTAQPVVTFDDK